VRSEVADVMRWRVEDATRPELVGGAAGRHWIAPGAGSLGVVVEIGGGSGV
jgi:hypothetical protein